MKKNNIERKVKIVDFIIKVLVIKIYVTIILLSILIQLKKLQYP